MNSRMVAFLGMGEDGQEREYLGKAEQARICHSRAGGNPGNSRNWIPAFTRMTTCPVFPLETRQRKQKTKPIQWVEDMPGNHWSMMGVLMRKWNQRRERRQGVPLGAAGDGPARHVERGGLGLWTLVGTGG
jgi:hypothetical protein